MSSSYKLNSLRYRWFLNTSILQIFATLLMSYVSFKYSDFYTIKANIAVFSFLTFFSLSVFMYMRVKRVYTCCIFFNDDDSNIKNALILISVFLWLCLKSFLLILGFSIIDRLPPEIKNLQNLIYYKKESLLILVLIIAVFTQLFVFYRQFQAHVIKHGISLLRKRYNLDIKKTYFFADLAVTSFKINSYLFSIPLGLMINNRWYSESIVFDYLNIAGIGFNDLDDGHIRNIEMYGYQ